jgi:iron complex outermembrane receptor protein
LWCGCGLLPAIALAEPVVFDVPAQPVADALLAFSQQAKIEVLFSFDELRQVQSTAVVGRYEPEDALSRLLRGTSFGARRNDKGKFVVMRIVRPVGSVKGRLLSVDGTPARAVRVTLPEARQSTITDERGEFHFAAVPSGTHRLIAVGAGLQPLQMAGLQVVANRVLTVETQKMPTTDELIRLAPYVVEGGPAPRRHFDRGRVFLGPRMATGNLDLPRTEDDPLPYTIYDRDQISRSGVVNLNEFLQRAVLDSDAATHPPEQDGNQASFISGSMNLNLRGYGADETVVLINGRRLPEILISGRTETRPPDVNFIPLSLVQQIEVLPVSASALYSGNAVGGVINIVLRPDTDATEVTATHTNAVGRFDAPQSSVSLQHGETLLGRALRLRFSATFTRVTPPTERELGYIQARAQSSLSPADAIFRATPNIRGADLAPLFGPGTSPVTSVAPGADGTGGLAAFAGRQGVRSLALFDPPGELATSTNSLDYPYGRRQRYAAYYGSAVWDVVPWLQVGLDGTYARTVVNRGYDVFAADLLLKTDSALNPFGQDIRVSLNETAPLLGEDYSEARLEFSSAVLGLMLKLPVDWRVSLDTQYAHNFVKYRGLAPLPDSTRWQQLVDEGLYNPLRDTQVHGPPQEFYDRVLVYYGNRGRFVTLGNYETLDVAVRVTNQSVMLPTGVGALNFGGDYRRNHLAGYTDERRFADGSLAYDPVQWSGRTLERVSVFGELQGPLLPTRRLPHWLRSIDADLAVRYVAAASSREANVAPTCGLKADFAGGFSLRGSFTTSNRYPTPYMSRQLAVPVDAGTGEVSRTWIFDPARNQSYDVLSREVLNPALRPEAAATQTVGVIFQRGDDHRFRAAVDFVDTRKVNELTYLDAQAVMNLESLWPARVQRASLAPGDGHSTGYVTSVFTGTVNLAWRRSHNWNLSLDYAWKKCLGGTLELYARGVCFQRYDRQVFPNSETVDELRQPDGTAAGLLKYRANFGGSWTNRHYGFGMDGHYFHSRILPSAEWPGQGGDQIDSCWQFDAYLQSDLGRWLPWKSSRFGLRGQLRVNNVLGAHFPKYANDASGAGVQAYGDWRGRVYSLSLTATF